MVTPAELFKQLDEAQLMVVSTVNATRPEAAVVGFTLLEDQTIVMATNIHTRKYINLTANPQVALVIGWDGWSAQIEGQARVADGAEAKRLESVHIARNPHQAKLAGDPDQRYIVVTPKWARLTDYRGPEAMVEEVQFGTD